MPAIKATPDVPRLGTVRGLLHRPILVIQFQVQQTAVWLQERRLLQNCLVIQARHDVPRLGTVTGLLNHWTITLRFLLPRSLRLGPAVWFQERRLLQNPVEIQERHDVPRLGTVTGLPHLYDQLQDFLPLP